MSRPENPLNKYSSYSYYHVLLASNTTEIYDKKFEADKTIDYFRKAKDRSLAELKKDVQYFGSGECVVILNGAQDVDFYIKDIQWSTIFVPNPEETGIGTNSACAEGTMTIVEPHSARFFEYLNNVCTVLGSDPVGIVFYLKTFFVGYPDPSDSVNSNVASIVEDVKPFGLVLYDIVNDFNQSGSEYLLSFIGLVNGASRLSAFSRLPEGCNIISVNPTRNIVVEGESVDKQGKPVLKPLVVDPETDKRNIPSESLRSVVRTLAAKWNEASFKEFSKQAEADPEFKAREVRIKINIDSIEYKDTKDTKYLVSPTNANETEYRFTNFDPRSTETNPESGKIVLDAGTTVEQSIATIMNGCPRILWEHNVGVVDNPEEPDVRTKYTYKIYTTIKMTKYDGKKKSDIPSRRIADRTVQDGNRSQAGNIEKAKKEAIKKGVSDEISDEKRLSGLYNIHDPHPQASGLCEIIYSVKRVPVPQSVAGKSNTQLTNAQAAKNAIEFDYVYTGQNVDIVNMDMKMDLGYLAFQSLRPKNNSEMSKNDPNQITDVTTVGQNQYYTKRPYSIVGPAYPIYSDPNVLHRPLASQYVESRKLLNRIAILSAMEAKITIRGNPNLLNELNITTEDLDTSSPVATNFKLAKINVRMLNDALSDADPNQNKNIQYTTPFWYEGYYIIVGVEQKFSDGEFLQELDLIALVNEETEFDLFGKKEEKEQQTEKKANPPTVATIREKVPEATFLGFISHTTNQLSQLVNPTTKKTPSGSLVRGLDN